MNQLKDLSLGAMVVLVLVFVIQIHFMYDDTMHNSLNQLDANGDGVITRAELKQFLEQSRRPPHGRKKIRSSEIVRAMTMGVFRGLLMGLVLKDLTGGITLAIVAGLMNPVMVATERYVL